MLHSFFEQAIQDEAKVSESSPDLSKMLDQLHINTCPLKQRRQDVSPAGF